MAHGVAGSRPPRTFTGYLMGPHIVANHEERRAIAAVRRRTVVDPV